MHIVLYLLSVVPILLGAFFVVVAGTTGGAMFLSWLTLAGMSFLIAAVLYVGGAIVEAIKKGPVKK